MQFLNEEEKERIVYMVNPHYEPERKEFTKYWALSYTIDHNRDVLDVQNMCLLDKDWEKYGEVFKSR